MEYIIYTDESVARGQYFSSFYGGALVRSPHWKETVEKLQSARGRLELRREVKWQKVTAHYVDRYIDLMDTFFDLVAQDILKVRIMFRQNLHVPTGLTKEQRENEYHLLYYQFIKHAFGLRYSNTTGDPITLRIYADQMPDTAEKNAIFKAHVAGLGNSKAFRDANIRVPRQQIAEVDSNKHSILQCLDVVLGAMQFRLNDKHKAKPEGARRRGKRTLAKERLYRHLRSRVAGVLARPNFNVGISTGTYGDRSNLWHHPYRHWLFVPRNHQRDESLSKP